MHNGTLISDLQSLVTKFGSVAQGKTSGDVTRPEGQSLSGVTARETNAATPPEPIQFVSSGVDSDTLMGVSEKDRPCKSGAGMTPPLKVSGSHSRCNSDLLAIQSSPDLSSASPSAGEVNQRFAEVIWDGECWVVVLWHGFEARLSAGEQEFPELGTDAKNYIKSFCDDGKVIF